MRISKIAKSLFLFVLMVVVALLMCGSAPGLAQSKAIHTDQTVTKIVIHLNAFEYQLEDSIKTYFLSQGFEFKRSQDDGLQRILLFVKLSPTNQ